MFHQRDAFGHAQPTPLFSYGESAAAISGRGCARPRGHLPWRGLASKICSTVQKAIMFSATADVF